MGELVALLVGLLCATLAFTATFTWRQYEDASRRGLPPAPGPPWPTPHAAPPPTPGPAPVFLILARPPPREPFCWICLLPLDLHEAGGACPTQ